MNRIDIDPREFARDYDRYIHDTSDPDFGTSNAAAHDLVGKIRARGLISSDLSNRQILGEEGQQRFVNLLRVALVRSELNKGLGYFGYLDFEDPKKVPEAISFIIDTAEEIAERSDLKVFIRRIEDKQGEPLLIEQDLLDFRTNFRAGDLPPVAIGFHKAA